MKKEAISLIDWVNSLDIFPCNLVESLEQLISGKVILEIVAWLLSKPEIRSTSDPWKTILQETEQFMEQKLSLQDIQQVNSKQDPEKIYDLLKLLAYLEESGTLPETNPQPKFEIPIGTLKWVKSTGIFKRQISRNAILAGCQTGVFLCDLVNRLEGKNPVITGIERKPNRKTQILLNIRKALDFLKKSNRMNSRYLWASDAIADGHLEIVWGLLSDIKDCYAPSKFNSIKSMSSDISEKARNFRVSFKEVKSPSFSVSPANKYEITNWLKALEIEYTFASSYLEDPLRNSLLICELLRVLGIEVALVVPSTELAILKNFNRIIQVLKEKKVGIPEELIEDPRIYIYEVDSIWALMMHLYHAFPLAVPIRYEPSQIEYGIFQIKQLENLLLEWLKNLGVIHPSTEFPLVIKNISEGNLLCKLILRLFKMRMDSNRACLSYLQTLPEMSQTFTFKLNFIKKESLTVILGLLEDIYKYTQNSRTITKSVSESVLSSHHFEEFSEHLSEENLEQSQILASFKYQNKRTDQDLIPYPRKTYQENLTKEENTSLINFLKSLGIFRKNLGFNFNFLPEFSDGSLLCQIVSKKFKINLRGIHKAPKTQAGAFRNIKLALTQIPDLVLTDTTEQEVYQGNPSTIIAIIQLLNY